MDLNLYKDRLCQLREQLLQVEESGQEAAQTVELDQSRVGRLSRMDAMQAQAMNIESQRRRTATLQLIEAALKRIEDESFGDCVRCGEEIDPKRLQVDPAALLCIDCAEARES